MVLIRLGILRMLAVVGGPTCMLPHVHGEQGGLAVNQRGLCVGRLGDLNTHAVGQAPKHVSLKPQGI